MPLKKQLNVYFSQTKRRNVDEIVMTNEPIRILHVIGSMNRGGAETMIMNLYRHIDRTRVQFDFVQNSGPEAAFDGEILALGGRIYHCPRYRGKNHFQYTAWWKAFFAEHGAQYRAVHGHIGSTASIYLYQAKKVGIYTIAHSHNTSGRSRKDLVYQVYAYPTRYIADFFFGCSADAGNSRFGKRLCGRREKFTVLNNAIETERFAFDPEVRLRLRGELGLSDKIVIGHIGRFTRQKNHEFLLQVFGQIHRMRSDAVLLLVGDGELRPGIEEQVKAMGLMDSVVFTGGQSDVSGYYQAMDVFAFPSLYEGLGIVAVEAQTAGLPCVISDRVSKECIVTRDLVVVQNLDDTPQQWAEQILSRMGAARTDHCAEVKACGYDVRETAQWLQEFYCKAGASEYAN